MPKRELRSAVDESYRLRTGSAHGNLVPDWAAVFEASEARIGPQERTALETSGALLSYDDLVDRALDVAERFASAGLEEPA